MRIPLRTFFARVGGDNVDDVIRLAAYGWFVVAGLQAVLLIAAALTGKLAGGDLVDPIVAVLGGFFLLRTKSRSVAGALFLYAAITTSLCLAKILGLTSNGVPLLTALIALWAGWRGWTATWFWQTRACALTNWNRVAAGAVLAVAITTLVLCAILAGFTDSAVPRGVVEFVMTAVLFLVPVAVLLWFTRKRTFAVNDPACPWPPKKG
jgi:hypothetical protein